MMGLDQRALLLSACGRRSHHFDAIATRGVGVGSRFPAISPHLIALHPDPAAPETEREFLVAELRSAGPRVVGLLEGLAHELEGLATMGENPLDRVDAGDAEAVSDLMRASTDVSDGLVWQATNLRSLLATLSA